MRQFAVRDGIAEMPEYRMAPAAAQFRGGAESWSAAAGGGPTGWIEVSRTERLPSYLVGRRLPAWGRLERLERYEPDVVRPDVQRGEQPVWGWTDQGRIGDPPLVSRP